MTVTISITDGINVYQIEADSYLLIWEKGERLSIEQQGMANHLSALLRLIPFSSIPSLLANPLVQAIMSRLGEKGS